MININFIWLGEKKPLCLCSQDKHLLPFYKTSYSLCSCSFVEGHTALPLPFHHHVSPNFHSPFTHMPPLFKWKLWTEKYFNKRTAGLLNKYMDCVICPLEWWLWTKKGNQTLAFLRCRYGDWPGICKIHCFWPRSSSGKNRARQREELEKHANIHVRMGKQVMNMKIFLTMQLSDTSFNLCVFFLRYRRWEIKVFPEFQN